MVILLSRSIFTLVYTHFFLVIYPQHSVTFTGISHKIFSPYTPVVGSVTWSVFWHKFLFTRASTIPLHMFVMFRIKLSPTLIQGLSLEPHAIIGIFCPYLIAEHSTFLFNALRSLSFWLFILNCCLRRPIFPIFPHIPIFSGRCGQIFGTFFHPQDNHTLRIFIFVSD